MTHQALVSRVEWGLMQPVLHQGRMTAIRRKADNSALLRLLRRTDAGSTRAQNCEAGK
ncbi:hypothetical protein [Qipengyuania sp. 902]|uniref:hypothetical protein n=1 Tax=Qipengyuania sp. 902 TaxID=3417565 RepID=UPI003EBB7F90